MPLQYVVSPKTGAIFWSLRQDATATPATHKRLYHNVYVFGRGTKLIAWQNAGSAGTLPDTLPVAGGAGRPISRRRLRERLLVKLNGEIVEVANVRELFRLLHSLKAEIPVVAKAKAAEIIKTGVKVGDARKEPKSIQVVEAPAAAKAAIEQRVDEMDRYYWKLVARMHDRMAEEDDELIMLFME